MRKRLGRFGLIGATLAALAVGASSFATAAPVKLAEQVKPAKHVASTKAHRVAVAKHSRVAASTKEAAEQPEAGGAPESDADTAAQATACQKAGIDPNADNVNYDDASGVCSLDTGSQSGG